VPQRILLRPDAVEYRLNREQYEALAEDLEGEGVLVRVLPAAEERALSGASSASHGGEEKYDLLIQVGSTAGEIVGTAKLVEVVRRRLQGHEGRGTPSQRRAKIFVATGEQHDFSFGDLE
jgi:hypothetical protein